MLGFAFIHSSYGTESKMSATDPSGDTVPQSAGAMKCVLCGLQNGDILWFSSPNHRHGCHGSYLCISPLRIFCFYCCFRMSGCNYWIQLLNVWFKTKKLHLHLSKKNTFTFKLYSICHFSFSIIAFFAFIQYAKKNCGLILEKSSKSWKKLEHNVHWNIWNPTPGGGGYSIGAFGGVEETERWVSV